MRRGGIGKGMFVRRAGARDRAPLRRTVWTAVAVLGCLVLGVAGCATQADVVDLQTEMEKNRAERDEIQNRLRVVESYFKERSTTVQRSQADIVIKLDQVATDLQTAQGKLEENSHLLADLSQRMDDQTFHSKELTDRLDVLDGQIAALGKSVADLEKAAGGPAAGAAPDQKPPGTGEAKPPAAPADQTIVLPGRPTERDKTTGMSPSEAYGLAYNDYLKGNYDLSLMGFQSFLTQFKTTSLAPNAQYWIGESFYGKKDYVKAIDAFDKVVADFPKSDKVPGALLKAGYASIELGDRVKAKTYLKKVVENYPLTNEGKLAKNKLAELK
ncbi:MAG TPA: tol-pal system protein YbgF [Nitrospiria bacterium]|nr:tol-pal system protein YbgF [Nitrospiria bacterium]